MDSREHGQVPGAVGVLAALLHAVAKSADGEHGGRAWEGLQELTARPRPDGAVASGRTELWALRRAPEDTHLAEALAAILLVRAANDDDFRTALDIWRDQDQIMAMERTIRSSPPGQTPQRPSPGTATGGKRPVRKWKRIIRQPLVWIGTLAISVATAIIASLVTNIGQNNGILPTSREIGNVTSGSPASIGNRLIIKTVVAQGLGCTPDNGNVYPASITPSLNLTTAPDRAPTHDGKTWISAPSAFDAVPASPVALMVYLTGPSSHAIIITGIKFHVLSRRPQVKGAWLNSAVGCGAAGSYRYGAVDLNASPPYWVPASKLPDNVRATALEFPYSVTANDPEELYVNVQMEHCECTWDAVLSWIDGNAAKSVVINDHGRPFVTTSVTGVTGADWYNSSTGPTPQWTSDRWPFQ